ncbi:hypothetical protein EDE04_1568 [Streptomyces sp. 2132.2]|nr:hypothetical protein EDE04_1568 [Streptomyces sp. 2132.2]
MGRLEESTTVHYPDDVVPHSETSGAGHSMGAQGGAAGRSPSDRPRRSPVPYAPGQGPGVGVSSFCSVSVLKSLKPRRR